MTFLKTLGSIIVKGLQIVMGFSPIVEAAYPQTTAAITAVTNDLQQIGNIIVEVEAIGQAVQPGLTGAQKLQGAAPLIAQVIMSSSLLVGHVIADPAKFNTAVTGIASNFADLLNSLQADAIATQSKTA